MQIYTLALPIGFLIALFLLLWFVITAKGTWYIKSIVMVAFPLYALLLWQSLDSYLGWPAYEETPDRFILLKGAVREPNPLLQDEGAIYFWLIDFPKESQRTKKSFSFFSYRADPREPRAHKLPYSRELHEMMLAIELLQRQGKVIVMEKNAGKGFRNNGEEGKGNGKGVGLLPYDEFRYYELPPPKFEPK